MASTKKNAKRKIPRKFIRFSSIYNKYDVRADLRTYDNTILREVRCSLLTIRVREKDSLTRPLKKLVKPFTTKPLGYNLEERNVSPLAARVNCHQETIP